MNCVNRSVSLLATICIFLFAASGRASAKDHQAHCKDWIACLGIAVADQQKFCEGMRGFSAQIDTIEPDIRAKLRDEYGIQFKHRLLFHWGFNNDPKNSEPLLQKLDKSGLSAQKREDLFKYLREQQKQRNGKMISRVEAITELPKGQSRALTTILYDVHILGDYDTEDVEPLLDIRKLNFDLKQKGILRMEFKTGQEELLQALDRAESAGGSEEKKAENIIKTIKDRFPGLLSKQWHGALPSGIRLTGQETDNAKGTGNTLTRMFNTIKRLLGR